MEIFCFILRIEIGSELETTVIVNQPQTPPPLPKTFRNYIFNDNFGIKYDNLHDTHNSWSFVSNGITQSIFYLRKLNQNLSLH